jgi:hypothetical protein
MPNTDKPTISRATPNSIRLFGSAREDILLEPSYFLLQYRHVEKSVVSTIRQFGQVLEVATVMAISPGDFPD